MNSENIYIEFIQIVKLIALSAEKQIQILPDFVEIPDEIALAYNDIYLMIPQIEEEKAFPIRIVELSRQLNLLFNSMSKDALLWSMEYFEHGKLWENIRQLARSILKELNEANDTPDLGFIQWIKNN